METKETIKKYNIANYYKKKAILNKQIQYHRNLVKDDVIHRIVNSLAQRANKTMKKQNINKKIKHIELIGCDYDNLKDHLTSLFKTYMTFDNYGEWELDHIQPISSFNLNIEAEFKACFHYTNIQPLWKSENRKKSNKSNYISEDNY